MKIEYIGLYRYRPIRKKAYRRLPTDLLDCLMPSYTVTVLLKSSLIFSAQSTLLLLTYLPHVVTGNWCCLLCKRGVLWCNFSRALSSSYFSGTAFHHFTHWLVTWKGARISFQSEVWVNSAYT